MAALFKQAKKETKKKSSVEEAKSVQPKTSGGDDYFSWQILSHPKLSEKVSLLEAQNKYVFLLRGRPNKISVKRAIEKTYNVKVTKVNILKEQPKVKKYRGQIVKIPRPVKKVIVTLAAGQKINLGAK
jgi:large subunit ribosomal protein L23